MRGGDRTEDQIQMSNGLRTLFFVCAANLHLMTFRWSADNGPTLNACLLVALLFSGDPDQYC